MFRGVLGCGTFRVLGLGGGGVGSLGFRVCMSLSLHLNHVWLFH